MSGQRAHKGDQRRKAPPEEGDLPVSLPPTSRDRAHASQRPGQSGRRKRPDEDAAVAARYQAALRRPAPGPDSLAQRVSRSGTSWAKVTEPSLLYARAQALLAACGMDAEVVDPDVLEKWLGTLAAQGALKGPVEQAMAQANCPAAFAEGGFMHTLGAFPVVAGMEPAGGPCINPVEVLRRLRGTSSVGWRHAFAVGLLGVSAELSAPVTSFEARPNKAPDVEGAAEAMEALVRRDIERGWLSPWPKGVAPPPHSPLSCVPKSNGRFRLICDDSSRDKGGRLRGPNGLARTQVMPFPVTTDALRVAAWLRRVSAGQEGRPVFLWALDAETAYRRMALGGAARGATCVVWKGTRYAVTRASMGSVWSASALNLIMVAVVTSLRSERGSGLAYCDDSIWALRGTRQQAEAFRERAIATLQAIGLPVAREKLLPCAHFVDWIGLRVSAVAHPPTVAFTPSMADALETDLAKIREGASMAVDKLRSVLGRLAWLAAVMSPARLWLRRLWQVARESSAGSARFSAAHERAAGALRKWFVRPVWRVDDIGRRQSLDDHPRFVVVSDASGRQGGAVILDLATTVNGRLADGRVGRGVRATALRVRYSAPIPQSARSELVTAVSVVQWVASAACNETVLFLSDSTAAGAALRGRAAAKARHADQAGEALAEVLLRKRIFVHSRFIPGADNKAADWLSREALAKQRAAWQSSAEWAAGLQHIWRLAGPLRRGPAEGILLEPVWRTVDADAQWFGTETGGGDADRACGEQRTCGSREPAGRGGSRGSGRTNQPL